MSKESFNYVYSNIKKDIHLASIAGGTDLVGCLVLGNLYSSVYEGEIQGPSLGIDVDVFDELSLSAVVDTSAIELIADVDSSTVYIIPDADWHGSATIDIIISDSRLTDTTTFTFTVEPVNDAPIISEASDASTVEDSLYSVGFELTDIDTGEVLILSALADTSAIMIDVDLESSIIHFVPDPDWNGISEITVIVADGELSDTTQFMLTVSNVPDKPYAILQDDINSIQGQVILIDGSESYDIDDDPLQYYWSIMPEDSLFALEGIIGDTVVTETAYLEFQSPIRSSEHKFNIKLWVENTSNLFSDEDSLMLTVQTLEANDILPDLSSLMLEAGKAVPITITIPDGFIVDSISINYANGDYLNEWYGTPYPAFNDPKAMYKFYKPESGIYKASLSNNVIFPLSENITGLVNIGYDRLMGDAGNSQLVKRQGSKNQFSVMFNAMYKFYSF